MCLFFSSLPPAMNTAVACATFERRRCANTSSQLASLRGCEDARVQVLSWPHRAYSHVRPRARSESPPFFEAHAHTHTRVFTVGAVFSNNGTGVLNVKATERWLDCVFQTLHRTAAPREVQLEPLGRPLGMLSAVCSLLSVSAVYHLCLILHKKSSKLCRSC
jgi:hypothetical protein